MAFTFTTSQVSASADYARYLWDSGQGLARKTNRYKDSDLLDFSLAKTDENFVRLNRGTYITIDSQKFPLWFTGYIINSPELVYLGKDPNTKLPTWGYTYQATADEYILSLKPIGVIPPFFNVTMGTIIKSLVNKLLPSTFDVSNIADGPLVAQYTVDPTKVFIDIVRDLSNSAGFVFYGNNKKLYFTQQDQLVNGFTLDKLDPNFTPGNLTQFKASTVPLINDATVLGDIEPQNYVTEYFVGTGVDSIFNLSAGVFGSDNSVFIDETFGGSSISDIWTVFDVPSNFLQVSQGYLNSLGGSGTGAYDVYLISNSSIPMDGRIRFTHGEWDFVPTTGSCGSAIIAGCWTAAAPSAGFTGLLYGLKVDGTTIKPVVSGVLDATQSMTIDFTKRYVIRTLVEFTKTHRSAQTYNYLDATGTVQNMAGTGEPDTVTWNTLITEVDPLATTGVIITNQFKFRNTAILDGVSDTYAQYVPLASDTFHATVTGITISIPLNATLETATILPFANTNLDSWDNIHTPSGWTVGAGTVTQETVNVNGVGRSCKITGNSMILQDAHTLVQGGKVFTITCRARAGGGNTGSLAITLYSVSTADYQGPVVLASTLSTTDFSQVSDFTQPLPLNVPSDLQLRVQQIGGGSGDVIYVDDINIITSWTPQIVGPNELDAIDGLAPVATVVSANAGAATKNSYTGANQYNPGQNQLVFFKDSVTRTSALPASNQLLRFSYRAAGAAVGRAVDNDSIESESMAWGDNGERSIIRADLTPRPRTSAECELAASAIVNENSFVHYEGQYTQLSDVFMIPIPSGTITASSAAHLPTILNGTHNALDGYMATIMGGTGAWAAANGTYIVKVVDGSHLSIPLDTFGFGAVTGAVPWIASHNEPKSGAIVKFLNFDTVATLLAEEIQEVITTIEPGTQLERFTHQVTFGKPDRVNDFVQRTSGDPIGAWQNRDIPSSITPVDVAAVGTLNYARDVTLPTLVGWDNQLVWIDAGQNLGDHWVEFEVRSTDIGWGIDDGKNLITRATNRRFTVPRALRGKAMYIREVDTRNLLMWSEDVTNSVWAKSSVTVINVPALDPDGGVATISRCVFSAGGSISQDFTTITHFTAFSFSIIGPVGVTVSVTIAGQPTQTKTLSGYWQRLTFKLPSFSISGTATVTLTCNSAASTHITRLSLERDTQGETGYTKTTSTVYGPTSRYSTLLNISFPFTNLENYEDLGFVINNSANGLDIANHRSAKVPGDCMYVKAVVKTFPTTGTVIVDVNKNGAGKSIFGPTKLQIAQPVAVPFSTISNAVQCSVHAVGHNLTADMILRAAGATGGWLTFNGNWTVKPVDADNFLLNADTSTFGAMPGGITLTNITDPTQELFATYPMSFKVGDTFSCDISGSDGTAVFNVEVKYKQTGN